MLPVERFYSSVMALDAIDPKESVCNFGMDAIFTRRLLGMATRRTGGYVKAIVALTGNPPQSHAWELAADYMTTEVVPVVAMAAALESPIQPVMYRRWARQIRGVLGINPLTAAVRQ